MAILTNIPAPYRIDQFNRLAASSRFSYKIYFYARTEANRSWDPEEAEKRMQFEHEYLRAGLLRTRSGHSYLAPGFLIRLLRERPAAVIVGGFSAQLAMALLYGRITGARIVVWSDSNILGERNLPSWRTAIRKRLVRGVSSAIACSTYGVEYFRSLGVPAGQIVISRYVSEPEMFRQEVRRLRPDRGRLRREEGIPDGVVVALVPARLEPEKGCRELLRVFAAVSGSLRPPMHLVFVGDGSLCLELATLAASFGVSNAVTFCGFHGYQEMPRYYAIADLVVLPSFEEPYGLVVNEGLSAGIPVLCSRYAGASDLVTEADGIVFNPSDPVEYEAVIRKAVALLARGGWPRRGDSPAEIEPDAANAAIERALGQVGQHA